MSMSSSSGSSATQAQHDRDVADWNFNWNRMQATHAHVTRQHALRQQHARSLVDVQNRRNLAERAHQIAIGQQTYANDVQAYNASIRTRNQQRRYNQLARTIATDDAARAQADRVTSITHQYNNTRLQHTQLAERAALDRRVAQSDVRFARRGFDVAQAELTGRRNIARSRHDIERDRLRVGYGIAGGRVNLSRRQVDQQLSNARAQGDIAGLGVRQEYRNAAEQAGLQARSLTLALRKTREEATSKGQDARLNMLRTTGTLSATGQTGRSARKNVQAAMAQNGRAQRIITGMLSTSEAEHGLNMDRVGQVLHNARTAGEIGLARISNDIAQAAVVHDIGLDTADVERIQANMNYRMGARTNAVDLLQSDLDISTGQRRNILDLERAQFQGNVADYRAGMTIRQSRQNSNASIAQLRDSRLSANRQHQADLRRVGQDFWAAQMAADARVAARPVRPVTPPAVIATPLPEVMAPQSPPTEAEYAATRPVRGTSGSSGMFGTALGFAGTLISAMASASSDDRLKRSYNRVGTSPSGVPVYTFNYIKDGDHGPTYMGTSAQDLIAMGRSDAVLQKEKDGFYYVDYSKLDVEFEKIT